MTLQHFLSVSEDGGGKEEEDGEEEEEMGDDDVIEDGPSVVSMDKATWQKIVLAEVICGKTLQLAIKPLKVFLLKNFMLFQ